MKNNTIILPEIAENFNANIKLILLLSSQVSTAWHCSIFCENKTNEAAISLKTNLVSACFKIFYFGSKLRGMLPASMS